jgi:hypothetical protein
MVATLLQAAPVMNKVAIGTKNARMKVSMDAAFIFAIVLC